MAFPYQSERGLFRFQAEGVAEVLARPATLAVWDTGIGKSHLAMATAAWMIGNDMVDRVLVVSEQNKVGEWVPDFETYTGLSVLRYHGPKRAKALADQQVLVSTYETVAKDAAVKSRQKTYRPTPWAEEMAESRVLVVYDEMTKLKNRKGGTHRAHECLLNLLRKRGLVVLGLTATPIERSPEDVYNLGRLLTPDYCTVKQFMSDHVVGYNQWGDPNSWVNLGPSDHIDPSKTTLAQKLGPVLITKSKRDPDVIDEFPERIEETIKVTLSPAHKRFYDWVEERWKPPTYEELVEASASYQEIAEAKSASRQLFSVLRVAAAHPGALRLSQGKLAAEVLSAYDGDVDDLGFPKLDLLESRLEPLVEGQGAQVVVFTYFGNMMAPAIAARLGARWPTALHTGSMSNHAKEEARRAFRAGESRILVSSDAGQRGINLPEASYVVNFEMPLTHASYEQRVSRLDRIDTQHELITAWSFVAEGTIEEPIAAVVSRRQDWHDSLVSTDDLHDIDNQGDQG